MFRKLRTRTTPCGRGISTEEDEAEEEEDKAEEEEVKAEEEEVKAEEEEDKAEEDEGFCGKNCDTFFCTPSLNHPSVQNTLLSRSLQGKTSNFACDIAATA